MSCLGLVLANKTNKALLGVLFVKESVDHSKEHLIKGLVPPARVFEVWKGLSAEDRKWFKKLSYPGGEDEFHQYAKDALRPGDKEAGLVVAIWRNNIFHTGSGEVFNRNSCRINHSCQKNAHFGGIAEKFVVRAITDIEEGEEILISYIRVMQPRGARREELKEYSFKCNCSACGSSSARSVESEERRKKLYALNKALPSVQMAPEEKITIRVLIPKCEEMLLELEKEPTMIDEMSVK